MGLRPEGRPRYQASLDYAGKGASTHKLWLGGSTPHRSTLGPKRSLRSPFLPLVFRGTESEKDTFYRSLNWGVLPGFQRGPAGPQGGGGPAQKAVPGGMRGRWVPAVSVLPSLPPVEGSLLPECPVPWSVPGKRWKREAGCFKGHANSGWGARRSSQQNES
jgi:hypothetical protein